jgi:arachidonate 15-lipoxygenase
VDIFYKSDEDVQSDVQLQNWASELVSTAEQGGQIQDFGDSKSPDRVISSKDYLKDALSLIIFTSSAQHAAVNFAQAYIMLYVPAFPGGLYSRAPDAIPSTVDTYSKDGQTPGLLTPDGVTKVQLDLLALLGGVYYTQLGQYDSGQFKDQQVNTALERFKRNLAGIGVKIREDNKTRPLKYPYFDPEKIPQSINI